MSTTISTGDRVRTFDFPDATRATEGEHACYYVGTVEDIVQAHHGEAYKIRVDSRVFAGERADFDLYVYPPINGRPKRFGGVTDGVELVETAA
jgi:hypothetical protein